LLERKLDRGQILWGKGVGREYLMQLSKEREAWRLVCDNHRNEAWKSGALAGQTQCFVVLQLLPGPNSVASKE
jgi:hypothetical protein